MCKYCPPIRYPSGPPTVVSAPGATTWTAGDGRESRTLFASFRQLTGAPLVFRAYVTSGATGRVLKACRHRHSRRAGKTGAYYADRCAKRMVAALARPDDLTFQEKARELLEPHLTVATGRVRLSEAARRNRPDFADDRSAGG